MDSLRGQLLIAAPTLVDPNFHRTVVLIADHSEEGAMGIVLNRPTETTVGEAVPSLADVAGDEALVYAGGPVQTSGVVVLAEFDDLDQAGVVVMEDIGFVGAHVDVEGLDAVTRRARVYAGHAGWGPGQLESELEDEGWIVEPADREDLFADDSEALWSDVLRRKGGRFALVARMPLDPSLN